MKTESIIFILLLSYVLSVRVTERMLQNYNPPNAVDNPSRFFKNTTYTSNIKDLPLQGKVKNLPFSGDYLAHRYGGVSARYGLMDTRYQPYPISVNMYHQPLDYLANKRRIDFESYVNQYYSPSEKYDLLVGDYKFTLTREAKNFGRKYTNGGDFESWMGSCHGLSPASYTIKTPNKPVILVAADGKTRIVFLPADIRSLATIWWANVNFDPRFTGSRDIAVNAASFFMIFANQIGRNNKNMCFEPSADAQIWNFSVIGYKANYFNLNTARRGSLSDTIIPLSEARESLKKSAPDSAKFVVGVNMRVDYAGDIKNLPILNSQPLKTKSSNYKMALYINDNNIIVGGGWVSKAKPSYVWGPDKIPAGPFDKNLPSFDGKSETLSKITQYATQSSGQLLPLREIVYYLAEKSN